MARVLEGIDAASNATSRYRITTGDSFLGSVSPNEDTDWVRLTVKAGAAYWARIVSDDSRGSGLSRPSLNLRNEFGEKIDTFASVLGFTADITGTYYIEAFSTSLSGTGNYRVDYAADIASDIRTRSEVKLGKQFKSKVDFGGDHDWVRVNLKAGKAYFFEIKPDASGGNGVPRGTVQIRNTDGDEVGGSSSLVAFTASKSGYHYLDVSSTSLSGTGAYTLSARNDIPADVRTKAEVKIGKTFKSAINFSDDADWVKVNLQKNVAYVFSMRGDKSRDDAVERPSLQLYNADGEKVGSSGGFLTHTIRKSGTYYLEASSTSLSGTGDYRIQTKAEIPALVGTKAAVTVGKNFKSSIDFDRDVDWIAVKLDAKTAYTLKLSGIGSDSKLPRSMISILDRDGSTLDSSLSNSAKNQLAFKSKQAGTYFIEVKGSNVFATGDYRVSVTKNKNQAGGAEGSVADVDAGGNLGVWPVADDVTVSDALVGASLSAPPVDQDATTSILEFSRGRGDRVDLQSIDANPGSAEDDAFAFIGTRDFSGAAGEVRYESSGGATFIYGDVNGDRKADVVVLLSGQHDLNASDFVL